MNAGLLKRLNKCPPQTNGNACRSRRYYAHSSCQLAFTGTHFLMWASHLLSLLTTCHVRIWVRMADIPSHPALFLILVTVVFLAIRNVVVRLRVAHNNDVNNDQMKKHFSSIFISMKCHYRCSLLIIGCADMSANVNLLSKRPDCEWHEWALGMVILVDLGPGRHNNWGKTWFTQHIFRTAGISRSRLMKSE